MKNTETIEVKNMLKGDRDALVAKLLGAEVERYNGVYVICLNDKIKVISRDGTVLTPEDIDMGNSTDTLKHYVMYNIPVERYIGFTMVSKIKFRKSAFVDNNTGEVIETSDDFDAVIDLADCFNDGYDGSSNSKHKHYNDAYYLVINNKYTYIVKSSIKDNKITELSKLGNGGISFTYGNIETIKNKDGGNVVIKITYLDKVDNHIRELTVTFYSTYESAWKLEDKGLKDI